MAAILLGFFTTTLTCELVVYGLWLYEVRVHRTMTLRGARIPYWTGFVGEWISFSFALAASALGALAWERAPTRCVKRPVVLLHDCGMTRGSMAVLAARLRRDGRDVFTVSRATLGGDLETSAKRVARAVTRLAGLGPCGRVDVIAHGRSGLVVRAAARYHASAQLMANVVSLGSPHQGAALADFVGIHRLAALRPRSRYLTALAVEDPVPAEVNFVTIASSFDAMVFPLELANYPGALNIAVEWPGHHALLLSERIYRLVRENLEHEPRPA